MGFQHDPEIINERYGVKVTERQVATLPSITNRLKQMMPTFKQKD